MENAPKLTILEKLYALVEPYIIPALITLAVAGILYLISTRIIIQQFLIWRESWGYSTREVLAAPFKSTWRMISRYILRRDTPKRKPPHPRALLNLKQELLKHDSISKALITDADKVKWIVPRGVKTVTKQDGTTNEVPRTYLYDFKAWLSPYPRAVKFFSDQRHNMSYNTETERYLPRKLVATMASRLIVREATGKESLGLRHRPKKRDFFVIEISCYHSTAKEVRGAVIGALETKLNELGGYEIRDIDPKNPSKVTLLVTHPNLKDILHSSNMPTGKEFSEKHPMPRDMHNIPFAITEKGDVWSLARIHTLFLGQTGAGKSSLVNTLCAQLAPAMLEGTAKLYAIDPKPKGEIEKYWGTVKDFFTDFAIADDGPDKWIKIIETVAKPLTPDGGTKTNRVQIRSQAEIDSGEAEKRINATEWKPTKETPLTVLLIDELPSLLNRIAAECSKAEFERAVTLLNTILYMGRAGGILLFAGTQSMAEKDLGKIARDQFPNRVALRQASKHFNDLVLGEGATKDGYDSTAFPDDPEFKGRAYARGEEGTPVQIRFPYYTTRQILEIAKPVLPLKAKEAESGTGTGEEESTTSPLTADEQAELDAILYSLNNDYTDIEDV